MDSFIAGLFAALFGFFVGVLVAPDRLDEAAKRGVFKVGDAVYVARPQLVAHKGSYCGLDVNGVAACVDMKIK